MILLQILIRLSETNNIRLRKGVTAGVIPLYVTPFMVLYCAPTILGKYEPFGHGQ